MGVQDFFQDINQSIDDIVEKIDNDFLTISHKADADGLASATVMSSIIDILKDYYGALGDNEIIRIMEFEKEGDDSLTDISSICEKNTYFIISDLGTLNPKEINKLNNEEKINNALVIDHHKALELNEGLFNINPKLYGINEEMSASAISGFYAIYALEKIKQDAIKEKISKERISKIEEKINKLLLISIGGDKADMQGAKGPTKLLYEYLINQKKLEEISSPFYGYKTKPFNLVVAETDIPFNLMYKIPTKNALKEKIKISDKEYDNERLFFAIDLKGDIGLNKQYIESNGHDLREIMDKYDLPIFFDTFTEDIKRHGERSELSNIFFNKYEIEGEKIIADMSEREKKIKVIKELFKENLNAFSDPLKLNEFIEQIYEQNYCAMEQRDVCIRSWSPSEQGNFMTALSKMGKGDLFIKGVKRELGIYQGDNKSDAILFSEINNVYENYKETIKNSMEQVESILFEELKEIKEGVYYLPLDKLQLNKDDGLTYTGVIGNLIANTRLLPNNYGIILTSWSINDEKIKISARINPFPNQKVEFGELFSKYKNKGICYSGGGHNEAASCKLYQNNLELFFENIKNENFGR